MRLFNNKFDNIYSQKNRRGRIELFTPNLTPGKKYYDEDVLKYDGVEYRYFDATRSKLAAGILKDLSQIGLKEGQTVLYLGASHGYTPSYVSDIIGKNGFMYALDFAPRVVRDLVNVCEKRTNMTPILADANQPDTFKFRLNKVDFVFQDVAQKNQAEIFIKNCKEFLKPGCFGMLAVKSRSIDITKKPKQVYAMVREKLERELTIVDYKTLDPFEKDHAVFVVKKR
jgi:fibrillarin-like pre-rRNA processing protein